MSELEKFYKLYNAAKNLQWSRENIAEYIGIT